MGDPAGVGPELCFKLLQDEAFLARHELRVFGSEDVLNTISATSGPFDANGLVDLGPVEQLVPGQVNAATGQAAHRYLEAGLRAVESGEVKALVTCPAHKEALAAAGVPYPGPTEFLVAESGVSRHYTMLTTPAMTCSMVTGNLALADVPGAISLEGILEVIELTARAMGTLHGRGARLAVLGLNPHAGEHGLFGDEEVRIIQPAVDAAHQRGIDAVGPLPPDTAFLPRMREEVDAYVCMYHDQGLIPLKTLDFEHAVDVTLGLPFVHTSVGHGTALDIAGQGVASNASLVAAVNLATRLVH